MSVFRWQCRCLVRRSSSLFLLACLGFICIGRQWRSLSHVNMQPILVTNHSRLRGMSGYLDSKPHQGTEPEKELPAITTPGDDFSKVRVLCWVMTYPDNLATKLQAVKETWGPLCDVTIYVSDSYNVTYNTINITVKHGRTHLTAKTMLALDYIYKHHLNDADWFMKADDDTYVIVDNLRHFLSDKNSSEPVFYGHHFRLPIYPHVHYFSGGAGYVMSRAALRLLAGRGQGVCRDDTGAEDLEVAKCLHAVGALLGNSLDPTGRTLFHGLNIDGHMNTNIGGWMKQYDLYRARNFGPGGMSRYPITYHYSGGLRMRAMHFLFHDARVYHRKHEAIPKDNYLRTHNITDPFEHKQAEIQPIVHLTRNQTV